MRDNNIEYNSIRVTKALREAIKGAAELAEMSEEDFIHKALAQKVGEVIAKKSEIITLHGDSVEEDLESLREWVKISKEGEKKVILQRGGNAEQMEVMLEAMDKLFNEIKDGDSTDIDNQPDNPFMLLWQNIEYENKWKMQTWEKSLEMATGEITLDEYEKFLAEEGRKYRETNGYLESEIPFIFVSRIHALAPVPDISYAVEELVDFATGVAGGIKKNKENILYLYIPLVSG